MDALPANYYLYLNGKLVEDLVIPNTVPVIGNGAFMRCKSLKSVTISEGVKCIGNSAFYDCINLTSVAMPKSMEVIGHFALMGCTNLTSIDIPNGVTAIGNDAFYGCTSLTTITIPESVTFIGESAFGGITGELVVNCNTQDAPSYGEGVFHNSNFTSVVFGENVTHIGRYALTNCTELASITIPKNKINLLKQAFKYDRSLIVNGKKRYVRAAQ